MSGHGKTVELREIEKPKAKWFFVASQWLAKKNKNGTETKRHVTGSYNVGRNAAKRAARKPYGMSEKEWRRAQG